MRRARWLSTAVVAGAAAVAGSAPGARAAVAPAAAWQVQAIAIPSRFSSEDNVGCEATFERAPATSRCDGYEVTATNVGSVATKPGAEVTIADALPAGVTVKAVMLVWPGLARMYGEPPQANMFKVAQELGFCTVVPTRCAVSMSTLEHLERCQAAECAVAPDESMELVTYVTVDKEGDEGTLTSTASVSGGGIVKAASTIENPVGGVVPGFGASADVLVSDVNGRSDAAAAGHPYEFRMGLDFNTVLRQGPSGQFAENAVEDPRDVVVDLPIGLLGSAIAAPKCTFAELSSHISAGSGGCPASTIVGHIVSEPRSTDSIEGPIYNMQPEHGAAAEFGYVDLLAGAHVLYGSVAPTSAGYVLRTVAREIPQVTLTHVVATFYGDPAARAGGGASHPAFFTNPSVCDGTPLSTEIHVDTWQHPGALRPDGTTDFSDPAWHASSAETYPEGLTGCELLTFEPELSAQPFGGSEAEPAPVRADSPAGMNFKIKVPQPEEFGTLATPALRKAVVRLPVGLTVDPSSANGLQACSEAEIGYEGFNRAAEAYEFSAAKPSCPDASKIGSVSVTTPLLSGVLEGDVFLADQGANPFGSLLAAYIAVDDPTTGTVVKLPGEMRADPATGQLTGVFDDAPQFPFNEFDLHFKGTSTGVLATPENCGTYTTTSELTPWSAPESGPAAAPSDSFDVTSGCVSGFAPSFGAGSSDTAAGGYTTFGMSFSRTDTDQEIGGLTVTLPPGLLAKVAGVPLCTNEQVAQAAANPSGAAESEKPSCPPGSQVGTVRAGAGPGPTPYFAAGKVYLTGPYKGGPYGLAVVVPAVAGPFDLGNVVVRVSLRIDPSDGHVTAVSDPFPTMVNATGIPVRLRRIDVNIDRTGFALNPTSCEAMQVVAAATSVAGTPSVSLVRFQVGGCSTLRFDPSFTATTDAHTSRADGASLTVKVSQRPGEANIHKVQVQLPIQLPSRLSTIHMACTEQQFAANPAGCPAGSNVGSATAVTPILDTPLTGPAYLVSHGGAAFPDLEMVLQGDNVTIVLDGKTDIKHGITYSRFETVPDAPISSFTASFPKGPHSVLGAYGSLCTKRNNVTRKIVIKKHGHAHNIKRTVRRTVPLELRMPTTLISQSGMTIHRSTKITVSACHHAKHHAKKP